MRLDEFLMKTHGFDTIAMPTVLIREKQILVNGNIVELPEFPISAQDTVSFANEALAKKNVHYWNMKKLHSEVAFSPTEDVLSFGLDKDEIDFLQSKKHGVTVVCLPQEVRLWEGQEMLIANPLIDELARKTKRKYNIFAFGPQFNSFRIGKIMDVNKSMLMYGSKIIIRIQGDEKEAEGQRQAIKVFADALAMEELVFCKLPHGRYNYGLVLRKTL